MTPDERTAACLPTDHEAPAPVEPLPADDACARAAALFRAAGDVSRLKLLMRLTTGERCVTELAQAARVTLPTVSQQLRLLHAAGLVTRRRSVKHVYYALAGAHVRAFLESALELVAEDPRPPDDD